MKECVTPHKISIFVLIRVFAEVRMQQNREKSAINKSTIGESDQPTLISSIGNPRYRRNYCMLMLKLVQGPDMSLRQLCSLLLSKDDYLFPELYESFRKHLEEIVELDIEGILELVCRVKLFLNEPAVVPTITNTSVLGLYIRRTVVMFEKLTCSGVVEVFKAFKAYQQDAPKFERVKRPVQLETPRSRQESFVAEAVEQQEAVKLGANPLWTRRQAELFLSQQSSQLSKNEATAMNPVELHTRIQELLKANPECSEAYFLAYLNFLRVRDFCGSLHSLYHCFDRGAGFTVDSKQGTVSGSSEDKARSYRYGALNLAMFYASFGHKKEAMLALKECVMLAHGASCNFCLQHALTWLYRLTEQKVVLMGRSIARSSELGLNYLASLGVQALAQHSSFFSEDPAIIFELLTKSDILNCQHSMLDLAASSYTLKSTLWSMYGRSAMSSLYAQLLLHSEVQEHNAEATCLAMCQVATRLFAEGETQNSSLLLKNVSERFPQLLTQEAWVVCSQTLDFQQAMWQSCWQTARHCAQQLAAFDPWQSRLQLAELCLACGDSVSCIKHLETIYEHCRAHSDPVPPSLAIRASMLHAQAFGSGSAACGEFLVSARAKAEKRHLTNLCTILILRIAEHQLQLRLPSQALSLVNSVLLASLAHSHVHEQAEALLLQAKCRLALADRTQPQAWSGAVGAILDVLQLAKLRFEKCKSITKIKEVLLLQALLLHQQGLAAEKFRVALELRYLEELVAARKSSHV